MASGKETLVDSSKNHKDGNTKSMASLSLEQRLDLIDEEFHKLHMFCVKSGYSPDQIDNFAEPFSKKVREASRKKWITRLIGVFLFSCALWPIFNIDCVNKLLCTVGRRAAIQVMPIYDWSKLYDTECLIDNPLHEAQFNLKVEDCNSCENQNQIARVKNIAEADLIQKYIKQDKPVIVEDGIKQEDGPKFTIEFLAKIFGSSLFDGCEFNSNVKVRGHRSFLKQAAALEHKQYFAYWRNCFEDPAKELRNYFKRPYFLSSVVEIAETSWIYVSHNYTAKVPKPILVDGPMVVLMQMTGSIEVILFPDKVCSGICTELKAVLHEGEILLVNDFLWMLDYYPREESESVGIGLTASFD